MVLTADLDKNKKIFYLKDLLVYLSAIAIVLALFCAFVIFPKTSKSFTGFNLSVNNDIALSVSFDGQVNVSSEYVNLIDYVKDGDSIILTVHSNVHLDGYNKIVIDLKNKTALVSESNCSNSKDCVYTPKISNTGAIYCAPHALKISAIGSASEFVPPTVG